MRAVLAGTAHHSGDLFVLTLEDVVAPPCTAWKLNWVWFIPPGNGGGLYTVKTQIIAVDRFFVLGMGGERPEVM